MELTDEFCDTVILEKEFNLKSTETLYDDSKIAKPTAKTESRIAKTEKCDDKSESNTEDGLLNIELKTSNENIESRLLGDSSPNNSDSEDKQETITETNYVQDLSLESKPLNEATGIIPPLSLITANDSSSIIEIEYSVSEVDEDHKAENKTVQSELILKDDSNIESKTSNDKTKNVERIKTVEDFLSKSQNYNFKGKFTEPKETKKLDENIEPSLTTQKSENLNKRFTVWHEDEVSDSEDITEAKDFEFGDISMGGLLRGTISELERALQDSRALIKTRDEDIVSLRKEVEKGREQLHKEQIKWQRKCATVEQRGREIQELKKKLEDSEKTVEELSERIKEFESPCSESDEIIACCSSMKELLEVKMELVEKDEIIKEIQKNNPEDVLDSAIVSAQGWKAKKKREKESGEHNELKLKFLRDAFFYFMIDFHSEEQMKAILAVLSYGDQREDVIHQAYRMRQRGKRFSVKEVSSRGLAFLHEEN